jgi:hypothetical protein
VHRIVSASSSSIIIAPTANVPTSVYSVGSVWYQFERWKTERMPSVTSCSQIFTDSRSASCGFCVVSRNHCCADDVMLECRPADSVRSASDAVELMIFCVRRSPRLTSDVVKRPRRGFTKSLHSFHNEMNDERSVSSCARRSSSSPFFVRRPEAYFAIRPPGASCARSALASSGRTRPVRSVAARPLFVPPEPMSVACRRRFVSAARRPCCHPPDPAPGQRRWRRGGLRLGLLDRAVDGGADGGEGERGRGGHYATSRRYVDSWRR